MGNKKKRNALFELIRQDHDEIQESVVSTAVFFMLATLIAGTGLIVSVLLILSVPQ